MRFHYYLVLAASCPAAFTTAYPQGDLFDDFAFSGDISPSNPDTDDSYLFDPSFQTEPAVELPPDDSSSLALDCTSSGPDPDPDDLISKAKAKARRDDVVCPSHISAGEAEDFNWERKIRQTIKSTENAAQASGQTLQFCPPPTQPLCCIGTPEYLGVEVFDCLPCKVFP